MVNYLWLDPQTGDTAVRANPPTGWIHVCYYYTNDTPALIVSTIPAIRHMVEAHPLQAVPPSGIIGNKISLTLTSGSEQIINFWASILMNCPLIRVQTGPNILIIKYDAAKGCSQKDWVYVDEKANMQTPHGPVTVPGGQGTGGQMSPMQMPPSGGGGGRGGGGGGGGGGSPQPDGGGGGPPQSPLPFPISDGEGIPGLIHTCIQPQVQAN